jgi:mRNA interferase HigB
MVTWKLMDIINIERIADFVARHPNASAPCTRWESIARKVNWRSFLDVKDTFNSADYVDGKVVFDLGGNNWRLLTVVDYAGQQIIIRWVLTHAEYNRGKWKQ